MKIKKYFRCAGKKIIDQELIRANGEREWNVQEIGK